VSAPQCPYIVLKYLPAALRIFYQNLKDRYTPQGEPNASTQITRAKILFVGLNAQKSTAGQMSDRGECYGVPEYKTSTDKIKYFS